MAKHSHKRGRGRLTGLVLTVATVLLAARAVAFEPGVQERAYLRAHPTLRLCVDPDWLPYEKLEPDGRYLGLVADYMELFGTRLGVLLKPTPVKTWAETQEHYREGECDLVSALNATVERVAYLDFTPPYLRSPAVLVVKESDSSVNRLEDLQGRSLAMVRGYVYEEHLRSDYPQIRLVRADSMGEAMASVSRGEVDATLGPLYLIAFSSQGLGLDNLKLVGNTPYEDELRVGVRKGDTLLLGILSRLIEELSPEDHAQLKRKWMGQWRADKSTSR